MLRWPLMKQRKNTARRIDKRRKAGGGFCKPLRARGLTAPKGFFGAFTRETIRKEKLPPARPEFTGKNGGGALIKQPGNRRA